MNKMKRILLWAVLLCAALPTEAQTSRQFVLENSADGESLLYCSLPVQPSGRAVMACPGGGYEFLSLEKEGTNGAAWFNERGIAYFTLKYRMPQGNPEIPLTDAYHAMMTIRDSAAVWGINPYDVGIMGFSAGGHLAATVSALAPLDVRPNFSILFYPVITMDEKSSHAGSVNNFLGTRKSNAETVRRFSPDQQVNHYATPPALVNLSNDDRIVPPVTNGIAYYAAMRRVGNECTLHVYSDGGHGYGFATWFKHREQMLSDLDNWLSHHKAPRQDAIRVACIGNSITRGSCIDMASQQGYPAQLQKILGEDYHVRNFGMPGYTVLRHGDYPYTSSECWQMAQDFQPQIIIIKLGTNDIRPNNSLFLPEFQADLELMVERLQSLASKPRILLAYPIRIWDNRLGMSDSVLTDVICPAIDAVADRYQLEVIDLHAVINDKQLMTSDGIHPNPDGARKLAETVAKAILPNHLR